MYHLPVNGFQVQTKEIHFAIPARVRGLWINRSTDVAKGKEKGSKDGQLLGSYKISFNNEVHFPLFLKKTAGISCF